MTQNSATFDTYDQIGIREDLENAIYNIAPWETPFMSMVDRMKAENTLHEWQTDTLDSPGSNAQVEADDVTFSTLSPTVRLSNRTQIFRKDVVISGTSRAVKTAGREDELPYQLAKKGKALKTDIEYALVRNQKLDAGSSSTARTLGSVESWLSSNYTKQTSGNTISTTVGYSSGALAAPVDGTAATTTFSESSLRTVMQTAWANGGAPTIVMVGPFNKGVVSKNFSGIATQYRENSGVKPATILGAAGIYVSDFGELKIVPSRIMRERTALVLDMDYWAVASLRPIKQIEIARTGDADKQILITELTLVSKNEKASGKVVDMASS